MHKLAQPVKLWYFSSFFRAEAPQHGRYREFWQVGAETLGSAAPEADAELIVLLAELLRAVGVKGTRLHLTSLGSPESRAEYREELRAYLRAHEDGLSEEVRNRIDLNPLRAFDATDPATRATMEGAPRLLDRLDPEDLEHFHQVRTLLDEAGVTYEIDTTLVRGLDYYTRTLFEFSSDALGAQSGVGGGGRYDRLIEQLDGRPTPAAGWAAGVERMVLAATDLPTAPTLIDLYVAYAEAEGSPQAFELARDARLAGLSAQLELAGRSLKGQLKQADRLQARYVAIVSPGAETTLREMDSGEQRELTTAEVIPTILRGSRLA
jgi:histidyl-tRNA synthetase